MEWCWRDDGGRMFGKRGLLVFLMRELINERIWVNWEDYWVGEDWQRMLRERFWMFGFGVWLL
jgi:hypothetical protein